MIQTGDLSSIQAGDQVIVYRWGSVGVPYASEQVERTTKTLIIVGDTRFRRKDGREVGTGSYDSSNRIYAVTEGNLAHVKNANWERQQKRERQQLITKLRNVRWRDVSTDKLERIMVILGEEGE